MKICISRTFSSKWLLEDFLKDNGCGASLTVTTKVCWGTIWRRLSKCNRLIHTFWIQSTTVAPWHLIKTRDGQWRHEIELKCGRENSGTTLHTPQCFHSHLAIFLGMIKEAVSTAMSRPTSKETCLCMSKFATLPSVAPFDLLCSDDLTLHPNCWKLRPT